MVNRICIGAHPTFGMGAYVSIPTVDVLSANKFQMAWSTLFEQFQILSSGSVVITDDPAVWSSSVTWSSLGYYPIIFVSNNKYPVTMEYTSTGSARFKLADKNAGGSFTPASDIPSGDATVFYIVTRSVKP